MTPQRLLLFISSLTVGLLASVVFAGEIFEPSKLASAASAASPQQEFDQQQQIEKVMADFSNNGHDFSDEIGLQQQQPAFIRAGEFAVNREKVILKSCQLFFFRRTSSLLSVVPSQPRWSSSSTIVFPPNVDVESGRQQQTAGEEAKPQEEPPGQSTRHSARSGRQARPLLLANVFVFFGSIFCSSFISFLVVPRYTEVISSTLSKTYDYCCCRCFRPLFLRG